MVRVKGMLLLFAVSTVLVSVGTFASNGYGGPSYMRTNCGADETPIVGLIQGDGYGSHIYSTSVDTPYNICFEEMYGGIEGTFEVDDCSDLNTDDYLHVIDIHDVDRFEDSPGSHISLANSIDGTELCIWHSGMKNTSRTVEINTGDERPETDWPDNEACYLLVTLAKSSNSHVGWSEWDVREKEVWVCFVEDYLEDKYTDVTVSYNTTADGSEIVTENRIVTFEALAEDEVTGVQKIEMYVSGESINLQEECIFSDSPEEARCEITTQEPFNGLENVEFNATVWSAGTSLDDERGVSDHGSFTVCGFREAEIGNGMTDGSNCNDGNGIRKEDCQNNQLAGFRVDGEGRCPPLFVNISASSYARGDHDVNNDILHPEAEDPVVDNCTALYDAEGGSDSEISGIYQENGFDQGSVPSGGSSYIDGVWDLGEIPYYCRGEFLEAEEYTVYEHENLDDSPVSSPDQGALLHRSSADGTVSLDPTELKMEFGVVEEAVIEAGLKERVFPMNVTNWNDRPVAVRISWDYQWDIFSRGEHWFARSFEVDEVEVEKTSYRNIEDYGDGYGYVRSPEVYPDSYDIQLVLGGRNDAEGRNIEEFVLVVETPLWTDPGVYETEVTVTRNEDGLEKV